MTPRSWQVPKTGSATRWWVGGWLGEGDPPCGDLGNLSRVQSPGSWVLASLSFLFSDADGFSVWVPPPRAHLLGSGRGEALCIKLSAETWWGVGHAALLPSLLQAAA